MTCTRPVTLYRTAIPMKVPCGKCTACRIAHSSEWAVRIIHELDSWKGDGLFVTLTYDEDHLPSDKQLNPKHLELFWKRLRKVLTPRKIRYYACGEYGENEGRPHYHAIIFGLSACCQCVCCRGPRWPTPKGGDCELLLDSWGQGNLHIGSVTYDSARYVADYIFKKKSGPLVIPGSIQPFQRVSQGLGKAWLVGSGANSQGYKLVRDALGVDVSMDASISRNKSLKRLPLYYVRKLQGLLDAREKEDLLDKRMARSIIRTNRRIADREKSLGRLLSDDDLQRNLEQHERNLRALQDLKLQRRS